MAAASYLLDTTILLHWTRDSAQAKAIEQQFQLSQLRMRPLICEVSVGEMMAFGRSQSWGAQKQARLKDIFEKQTVIVRISDPRVLDAYADLSTQAKSSGWSLFHGKNDLWVGAAARATGSHLLTMDTDFLPLRGVAALANLIDLLGPHGKLGEVIEREVSVTPETL